MQGTENTAALLGRVAMSVLFIYGGWGKLLAPAATQTMLASHDLPMVQFGWILAVVVELGGGLAILFGLFTRAVGLVLAVWCGATAVIAHTHFADRDQEYIADKVVEIGRAMGGKIVVRGGTKRPYTTTVYQSTHNCGGAVMVWMNMPVRVFGETLRAFASGVRASAIMSPIAKALSPDDVADVTAYFAGVDAPFLPLKAPDAALLKHGEELAKVGSVERRIQNCDNCHGPGGAGEPPTIPYLAGQHAHYIAFTLQMWQQGFRKNSPDSMGVIANKCRFRRSRPLIPR